MRWILDRGVEIAIWGGRRPDQMAPIQDVFDWKADEAFQAEVDAIVDETIKDPVGPQFMAPPARES